MREVIIPCIGPRCENDDLIRGLQGRLADVRAYCEYRKANSAVCRDILEMIDDPAAYHTKRLSRR